MASGDTLYFFSANDFLAPSTGYATFVGSSNGDLVCDFNASGDAAVFRGVMPRNYSGNGITANLHWTKTTTSTGTVAWALYFERGNDANHLFGIDSFGACQVSAAANATSTSGQWATTAISVANGAAMDSIAAGDLFRVRVNAGSSDSNLGHRRLAGIELRET